MPASLEGLLEPAPAEVLSHHEGRVRDARLEAAGIGQRVGDADAEAAVGPQHSCRLSHCSGHVLDVHERVVGDDQIEGLGRERECGGVGEDVLARRIGRPRGLEQRRRRVDAP